MQLKRLWDTTQKKMAYATWPSWKECQVWCNEDGSKLYIYDMAQWLEYTPEATNAGKIYWPVWKDIPWEDEVWFYDSPISVDVYTWEDGDEASYAFKDWDGTVLKEGKVKEGTAPTPPADPTRSATAQYTYTFAWWNPEVWPITKTTIYTATYTATVNEYTITWLDGDGNTLDTDTLEYGATPVYEWETPTKTATAQYTYTFNNTWSPEITTVTWNATYTAQFDSTVNQYTVTIASNDTSMWTVDESEVVADYGTAISVDGNVLTIGETEITATAESWYDFANWGTLPATVTWNLSITATFESGEVSETIYSWDNGTIVHKYKESWWEIILTYTWSNTSITPEIIIADRNLWATKYYGQTWATDTEVFGNIYQWGNNYWFPNSWATNISSTQVDASWYGPWNYYSSDTFITGNWDWSSVANNNLWGDTTNTDIARQWPCPSGWHVPSEAEFRALVNSWQAITWRIPAAYTAFQQHILSGLSWMLDYSTWTKTESNKAYLRCSSYYNDLGYVCRFWYNQAVEVGNSSYKSNGCSIRPFKNTSA